MKELEKNPSHDNANDTIAALLCNEFQKQSLPKTKLSIGFRLNIYTTLDKCGFSISLKLGEKSEINYDNKQITINNASTDYEFKDGKLSMEQNGAKLIFTKD